MNDTADTRCARHPGVVTSLRCGKCATPICPRCLVQTPVGARCPACARLVTPPTFRVTPAHYARAVLAALGAALVLGILWAVLDALLPFILLSLGLAAATGYAAGEAISRAVNRKSSTGLAVIGALTVVAAYSVRFVLPALLSAGFFIGVSFHLLDLLGLGLGIFFAASRLRRPR